MGYAVNYYRHYLGDYQRDTSQLSLLEHGAFRMLLDAYYSSDGPLPADEDTLFRMARAMTAPEQHAVRMVAARYFVRDGDTLRNARADAEIAIGLKAIDASRANGKLGGRPVRAERTQQDTQPKPSGIPSGVPSDKAPQPPTPNPQEPAVNHQAKIETPSRVSRKKTRDNPGGDATWMTPFSVAWDSYRTPGRFPFGKAAKPLRMLLDLGYTTEYVAANLGFYLKRKGVPYPKRSTDVDDWRPAKFTPNFDEFADDIKSFDGNRTPEDLQEQAEAWLSAPAAAWDKHNGTGSFPYAKAGLFLKPLHSAGHSPEKIAAHLDYYLSVGGDLKGHLKKAADRSWGGFKPNLSHFAETFMQWNPDEPCEP